MKAQRYTGQFIFFHLTLSMTDSGPDIYEAFHVLKKMFDKRFRRIFSSAFQ